MRARVADFKGRGRIDGEAARGACGDYAAGRETTGTVPWSGPVSSADGREESTWGDSSFMASRPGVGRLAGSSGVWRLR
ncbi:hypothetical protein HHA04nite_21290 [Halomonas halophila]|uniref:Uncharacterized protein n=1 Tax=Halomonas halophila TaxID=29573 RepID=A0ABQ0U5D7_9GAMM|nr:hypothetical protein HHA04nite_21290 [Halomonas halophila]